MASSDDDPPYVARFKEAMIDDLNSRKDNLNLPWLKLATALDPRFKLLKCFPKDERDDVWRELQRMIARAEEDLNSNTGDVAGMV